MRVGSLDYSVAVDDMSYLDGGLVMDNAALQRKDLGAGEEFVTQLDQWDKQDLSERMKEFDFEWEGSIMTDADDFKTIDSHLSRDSPSGSCQTFESNADGISIDTTNSIKAKNCTRLGTGDLSAIVPDNGVQFNCEFGMEEFNSDFNDFSNYISSIDQQQVQGATASPNTSAVNRGTNFLLDQKPNITTGSTLKTNKQENENSDRSKRIKQVSTTKKKKTKPKIPPKPRGRPPKVQNGKARANKSKTPAKQVSRSIKKEATSGKSSIGNSKVINYAPQPSTRNVGTVQDCSTGEKQQQMITKPLYSPITLDGTTKGTTSTGMLSSKRVIKTKTTTSQRKGITKTKAKTKKTTTRVKKKTTVIPVAKPTKSASNKRSAPYSLQNSVSKASRGPTLLSKLPAPLAQSKKPLAVQNVLRNTEMGPTTEKRLATVDAKLAKPSKRPNINREGDYTKAHRKMSSSKFAQAILARKSDFKVRCWGTGMFAEVNKVGTLVKTGKIFCSCECASFYTATQFLNHAQNKSKRPWRSIFSYDDGRPLGIWREEILKDEQKVANNII